MPPALRVAGLFAAALALVAPTPSAQAASLAALQQRAEQCFRGDGGCDGIWPLAHQLKQRAEAANQLRCYSALLALEAMVTMAELGAQDPARQREALAESSRECR